MLEIMHNKLELKLYTVVWINKKTFASIYLLLGIGNRINKSAEVVGKLGIEVYLHRSLSKSVYDIRLLTYSQVSGNGRNTFPLGFWNVLQTMEDLLKKTLQCCI